jgi:hypothetical protein
MIYFFMFVTMNRMPQDVLRYEIMPRIDSASLIVVRNVLLGKPFPNELIYGMDYQILRYNKDFIKIFLNLGLIQGCCVADYAAYKGDLELLQWARANGFEWGDNTCAFAAFGGHLDLLQWAYENGCDEGDDTFCYAARGGSLAIVKWVYENDLYLGNWARTYAVQSNHVEIIKYLDEIEYYEKDLCNCCGGKENTYVYYIAKIFNKIVKS